MESEIEQAFELSPRDHLVAQRLGFRFNSHSVLPIACSIYASDPTRVLRIAQSIVACLIVSEFRRAYSTLNSDAIPAEDSRTGLLPLTQVPGLLTAARKSPRILPSSSYSESLDYAFRDLSSEPVDQWVTLRFFVAHVSQYRRRPIAWQLQSGKFTTRTSASVRVLSVLPQLDVDTLPKLRSQYVGPMRQRLETELQGVLGHCRRGPERSPGQTPSGTR